MDSKDKFVLEKGDSCLVAIGKGFGVWFANFEKELLEFFHKLFGEIMKILLENLASI